VNYAAYGICEGSYTYKLIGVMSYNKAVIFILFIVIFDKIFEESLNIKGCEIVNPYYYFVGIRYKLAD
jgi:hypothetical protein